MAFYPPSQEGDYYTLEPAAGQTMADLDGELFTGATVGTRHYLAPASWVTMGDWLPVLGSTWKMKSGYVSPDQFYRWKALGDTSVEPPQEQQDAPIDLTEFVPVFWSYSAAEDGLLWSTTVDGSPSAYIPTAWVDTEASTIMDEYYDNVQPMIDGYLTPGLLWMTSAYAAPTVIAPPVPTWTDESYTLPDVEGVIWEVDGEPAEPGEYTPDTSAGDVTVVIVPTAADGYAFDPEPRSTEVTFRAAPTKTPRDVVGTLMEWSGVDDRAEVKKYHEIVRAFIYAYTRGRGFADKDIERPAADIDSVITVAAMRLIMNPEQAESYRMDEISVKPAVFNGYTLAEQYVLHRYRRRFA